MDLGYFYQVFFTITKYDLISFWFQYVYFLIFEIFKIAYNHNVYYSSVVLSWDGSGSWPDSGSTTDWWVYFNIVASFVSLNAIYIIALCNCKVIMAELEWFDRESSNSSINKYNNPDVQVAGDHESLN